MTRDRFELFRKGTGPRHELRQCNCALPEPLAPARHMDGAPRHVGRKTVHMDRKFVRMGQKVIRLGRETIHVDRKMIRSDRKLIGIGRETVGSGQRKFHMGRKTVRTARRAILITRKPNCATTHIRSTHNPYGLQRRQLTIVRKFSVPERFSRTSPAVSRSRSVKG